MSQSSFIPEETVVGSIWFSSCNLSTPALSQLFECKMRRLGVTTVHLYCPGGPQLAGALPFQFVLIDLPHPESGKEEPHWSLWGEFALTVDVDNLVIARNAQGFRNWTEGGVQGTGVRLLNGEVLGDVSISVLEHFKSWHVAGDTVYLNNFRD